MKLISFLEEERDRLGVLINNRFMIWKFCILISQTAWVCF